MGARTLVFVRHGQYSTDSGALTVLGREQARCTGLWIFDALEGKRLDALWSSPLLRARETATIIAEGIGHVHARVVRSLGEGMYSRVQGSGITASQCRADRARADAAYARLFRRSRADRLEVVVCHGNLIRYLVCRALDVPVLRWARMSTNHCGTTRVVVSGSGDVRLVSYNETAHLPTRMRT